MDEASDMDRLTQLQDSIDELVHIMSATVQYLTQDAPLKEVSPAYKVASSKDEGVDPAEFEAERTRLVNSLLKEAKKVEFLISVAPAPPAQDATYGELAPLQTELEAVNKDYLAVVAEGERLQRELNELMTLLLAKRPK